MNYYSMRAAKNGSQREIVIKAETIEAAKRAASIAGWSRVNGTFIYKVNEIYVKRFSKSGFFIFSL